MPGAPPYAPRDAASTVTYQVVQRHLSTFCERVDAGGAGAGPPGFVIEELRAFLRCGIPAHGFIRVQCAACSEPRIVPFSCKGRGICPSCAGRRMAQTSADLVDHVLPRRVPYRQWVLSLPFELRYLIAFDAGACTTVLTAVQHAITAFYVRAARADGVTARCRTGSATVIQRFGDGLRLNPHFHLLVCDGVFHRACGGGRLRFHRTRAPSHDELDDIIKTISAAVARRLRRDAAEPNWSAPAGRPRAACRWRPAPVTRRSTRRRLRQILCVRRDGFDLHANVTVAAHDRAALQRLARYLLRPAVPESRLRLLDDGRVELELRSAWTDGTTHLIFEPLDLIARLCQLVPPPGCNLVRYHGVLAPNAAWRRELTPGRGCGPRSRRSRARCGRYRPWAQLLKRTFRIEALVCPSCGGAMRILAVIEQPTVVEAILASIGLPAAPPPIHPARGPPQLDLYVIDEAA